MTSALSSPVIGEEDFQSFKRNLQKLISSQVDSHMAEGVKAAIQGRQAPESQIWLKRMEAASQRGASCLPWQLSRKRN
jgi:hypothetical protein